jgi:hypothetical protein
VHVQLVQAENQLVFWFTNYKNSNMMVLIDEGEGFRKEHVHDSP